MGVMQLNKMITLRLPIILAAFVICPSHSTTYTYTKTPSLIEALNANYDNLLDGIPCGSDDLMTCGHYCVHGNYKCDNITDCTDGRDEVPCCQEGYYSCLDGNCVEVDHACDGNFDCENGLDEFGCSNNLKDNRGCSLLPCMVEVEGGEEGVTTCERDPTCHATRSGHGNFLPQLADLWEQLGLGFKNDMKDDKEEMEEMEEMEGMDEDEENKDKDDDDDKEDDDDDDDDKDDDDDDKEDDDKDDDDDDKDDDDDDDK